MRFDSPADTLLVSEESVLEACRDPTFPELGVIEQVWDTDPIPQHEIGPFVERAVESLSFADVSSGGDVAVGVGSRGIANIPSIVASVVNALFEYGYEPFVFSAMGSHGGATAEGQREMLDALGVSRETVGCEVRSSMDVVEVGRTDERDVPVVADANAANADAILPINRIKPHTAFEGTVESGLSKMLVIGMGKHRGAKIAHEQAMDWSFRNVIPNIAGKLLDKLPVVGGVAILEDQRDETHRIEGVPPGKFLEREVTLLETAYDLLPALPFESLDVLVVDQHGKDVSGQGMDTNVIGRRPFAINEPEPERPDIKRIFVRRLTDATHGNAMGIGAADIIHRELAAELDPSSTLVNALTASAIRSVRVPPVVETDRAGLGAALSTLGTVSPETVRVLRVTDTMRLRRMYASVSLVEAARDRNDLRVVAEPEPIAFKEGEFSEPTPMNATERS